MLYESNTPGARRHHRRQPARHRAPGRAHRPGERRRPRRDRRSSQASIADLNAQRNELRNAERTQTQTLRDLAEPSASTLDAELDVAAGAVGRDASPRRAPSRAIRRTDERRRDRRRRPGAGDRAAPTAPTPPRRRRPRRRSRRPTPAQVSPHHNDPFLVCTRARESNGDYSVVSPSGYYGAYQFSPTTWNVTASHAGRLDLVGVLPSHASPYDQDEMAWALYQWQGNGPWGGRC